MPVGIASITAAVVAAAAVAAASGRALLLLLYSHKAAVLHASTDATKNRKSFHFTGEGEVARGSFGIITFMIIVCIIVYKTCNINTGKAIRMPLGHRVKPLTFNMIRRKLKT